MLESLSLNFCLDSLFFTLGILNNAFLISYFWFRKKDNLKATKLIGWLYFLLAIPAVYGLYLANVEGKDGWYVTFLWVFLAYLFVLMLFDYILKVEFRKKLILLVPYLALFYTMNYGFFIMAWQYDLWRGLVILGLFMIQVFLILSHYLARRGEDEAK